MEAQQMTQQTTKPLAPRFSKRARIVAVGASLAAILGMGGCVFGPRVKSVQNDTLYSAEPASMLVVENNVGDVTIVADPGATEFRAEITKIGRGRTHQQADTALSEIQVNFGPRAGEPDVIEATVWHPKPRHGKQYAVEWVITAPADLGLKLNNDVGDVEVEGFGYGASIQNDVGDVRAMGISGGLTVSNDVGDVRASATGDIDIKSDVGDVRLRVLDAGSESILVRTDVGDAHVVLPVGWEGRIDSSTDIGGASVRGHLSSLRVYRDKRGRFEGDVGDGSATLTIRTDVGNARVRIDDNDDVDETAPPKSSTRPTRH
jgi:hypothetical protein